jgi:hypothetical protein
LLERRELGWGGEEGALRAWWGIHYSVVLSEVEVDVEMLKLILRNGCIGDAIDALNAGLWGKCGVDSRRV